MQIENILSVAEKNFFANKYTDVKLDNIANDLNIKKPSLYYYFSDKKELFIQTMKYSEKKYLDELKKIISNNSIKDFLIRYLTFPYENKNLFGIAFQKEYCIDSNIKIIILKGKLNIESILFDYFKKFGLNNIQSYLVMSLLEKLTQNNCLNGDCLKYNIGGIVEEIEKIITSYNN